MLLPNILNERKLLGTIVEVGVQIGAFGTHLRRYWDGELYIGVDPYKVYPASTPMPQSQHDAYRQMAIDNLKSTNKPFELLRVDSLTAAETFAKVGKQFDMVFLDADHRYEHVLADIRAWWPLVKSGGILAGHDYVPDGWHKNEEPHIAYATEAEVGAAHCGDFGVVRAVTEFFGALDISPELTDVDSDGGWRSWLVVKP
jgi:cephalosporin hydroxylase